MSTAPEDGSLKGQGEQGVPASQSATTAEQGVLDQVGPVAISTPAVDPDAREVQASCLNMA
jgi:hypothetical protein